MECKQTFVKITTTHSMTSLVKNKSSASSLSLNPPNFSNHPNTIDFSNSKNLRTIDPGTRPAITAAAKSAGKLSSDLPASASTSNASSLLRSLSSSSPPPPPLPPPLLPLPDAPPPFPAEKTVVDVEQSNWVGVKMGAEQCLSLEEKKMKVPLRVVRVKVVIEGWL